MYSTVGARFFFKKKLACAHVRAKISPLISKFLNHTKTLRGSTIGFIFVYSCRKGLRPTSTKHSSPLPLHRGPRRRRPRPPGRAGRRRTSPDLPRSLCSGSRVLGRTPFSFSGCWGEKNWLSARGVQKGRPRRGVGSLYLQTPKRLVLLTLDFGRAHKRRQKITRSTQEIIERAKGWFCSKV